MQRLHFFSIKIAFFLLKLIRFSDCINSSMFLQISHSEQKKGTGKQIIILNFFKFLLQQLWLWALSTTTIKTSLSNKTPALSFYPEGFHKIPKKPFICSPVLGVLCATRKDSLFFTNKMCMFSVGQVNA